MSGEAKRWLSSYVAPLIDFNPQATASELTRWFRARHPDEYAKVLRQYAGSVDPQDSIRRTIARFVAGGTRGHAPVTVHLTDHHGYPHGTPTDRTIPNIVEVRRARPEPGSPAYTVESGTLTIRADVVWERPGRRRDGGLTVGTVQPGSGWLVGDDGVPRHPSRRLGPDHSEKDCGLPHELEAHRVAGAEVKHHHDRPRDREHPRPAATPD